MQFSVWYFEVAVEMKEGEASMPFMCPPGRIEETIWEVRIPSPQPRSRIWSPGCGDRYWRTFVVSLGTKEAAEV